MSDPLHDHKCTCGKQFSCQIKHRGNTVVGVKRTRQLCPNQDIHSPDALPTRPIRIDDDIFEMIKTRRNALIQQRGGPISRNQALRTIMKDAGYLT